jgi:GMP synthase-like glutamine amidotransferase
MSGTPPGTPQRDRVTAGLLLCDHLDPDVAAQVGDYTELFPAIFSPAGVDLVVYEVTRGEFPDRLDAHDGWIVSGSRRSTYEDEGWIHQLEELVRRIVEQRRRLVGICFGHQMTAQALGGSVEPAEVGWGVGRKSFDVVAPAAWMPPVDAFTILMSHRDQVTRLPEGAELVATTDYCPVGAYRIDDHVFCVQGHPEFVPELSRLLMAKRREVIGGDVVDAALDTLHEPPDGEAVVAWMTEFLRQGRTAPDRG